MKTIYKYTLDMTNQQTRQLPVGADILDVQFQSGCLYLWALVETENATAPRQVIIEGTGQGAVLPGVLNAPHRFTRQHGAAVWHIFVLPEACE